MSEVAIRRLETDGTVHGGAAHGAERRSAGRGDAAPAGSAAPAGADAERMPIVIAGHVDHGKSTIVGRLLADTGALPEGKLDGIRALCARTGKPFEYAFLLDALRDERSQGITID